MCVSETNAMIDEQYSTGISQSIIYDFRKTACTGADPRHICIMKNLVCLLKKDQEKLATTLKKIFDGAKIVKSTSHYPHFQCKVCDKRV